MKKREIIFLSIIIFFAIVAGCIGGVLIAYLRDLPQVKTLEEYQPGAITKIFSDNNELIGELYQEKRVLIPFSNIPQKLKEAIISVEDNRFYNHIGIDIRGIIRAFWSNLKAGKIVEGGSTITQQLAKILFLTPEKSFSRKLKEALLALQIENRYTKEEILELYCNQIYLGNGVYGFEAASRSYFGKGINDLTLPEYALLAGFPRAPSYYSSFDYPNRAKKRQIHVLRRMAAERFITKEECKEAIGTNLRIISKKEDLNKAPYFVEYIRQYLENKYGYNAVYKGGLSVYTSLNIRMQEYAQEALINGLKRFSKSYNEGGKTFSILESEEENRVDGAILAIDPQNGNIKVMIGGTDFSKSQFNRAYQAYRQAGSAFKPFIYIAALDNGFTAADVIIDSPVIFTDYVSNKKWKPENFSKIFYGPTTLRKALEKSRNVVTVKLLDKIGVNKGIEYARKMGITSQLIPNLTLALGTSEVSLLEMTSAYGVLANKGIRVEPISVRYVLDQNGSILEESIPYAHEVLSEEISYIITNLMRGVVENGTGRRAKELKRPVAAKTGTTDYFRDAWFIGYTPNLVAGVWVGYDKPESLGENETGSRTAGPIWTSFMKKALFETEIEDFPIPENIVFRKIYANSGLPANSDDDAGVITEAFIKGTEPSEYNRQETDLFRQEMR